MAYSKETKSETMNIFRKIFFSKNGVCKSRIDSFHIVSAHAPNCLVPRYLREITREGATFIRLPYNTLWNMENY